MELSPKMKKLDAQLVSPLLVPVAIIVMLLALAGCNSVVVMHDPKTGATAQCQPDSGNLFAQHAAETCAEGYEKLGWQRVN